MTSVSPVKTKPFVWTPLHKTCAIIIVVMFYARYISSFEAQTVFVRQDHTARLAGYARFGTIRTILVGLTLVWANHRAFHLLNLFYVACGEVCVVLICGWVGGTVVRTTPDLRARPTRFIGTSLTRMEQCCDANSAPRYRECLRDAGSMISQVLMHPTLRARLPCPPVLTRG